MKILKDVPLKLYSTMRLGGTADYLCQVKTTKELAEAEAWAEQRQLPIRVIGGGSNIIWRDEGFKGLLVVNKIRGFKRIAEDETSATYQIGAGEQWDIIVDQLVGLGLTGVECLSYIPGTAGATPIQNIGAYGQEIAQTLVEVEAYDRMDKSFVTLQNDQCAFGYRTSRFKSIDNGRFLISSLTLKLNKFDHEAGNYKAPAYKDLEAYFKEHPAPSHTPALVRKAVVAIRKKKLPDPDKTPNNGSYFGNAIIDKNHFKHIAAAYPAIKKPLPGWSQPPYWDLGNGMYKISAGWLIEMAGFSAYRDAATGMRIWPKQNLVFVNYRATRTQNLLDFEQKITQKVFEMFQIELLREPELLP